MAPLYWFIFLGVFNIIRGDTNYLRQPTRINASATPDIELRVVQHIAHLEGASDQPIASVVIRAYEYNGSAQFIGPTIVAKPGDNVTVTLINDLIGVGRTTEIIKRITEYGGVTNLPTEGYKDPDVTNLHTHGMYQIFIGVVLVHNMNNNNSGLHVSPLVDDVLLWTSPNCPSGFTVNESRLLDCWINETETPGVWNQRVYPYKLPSDHYPGTHWYVRCFTLICIPV